MSVKEFISSHKVTIWYNMPHGATCETRILRIFAERNQNEKMRQYIKKNILLTLSILISIVANAYDFEVGGIYYNKDGKYAIVTSGDSKYSGDVSIPSTVNYGGMEYSVTCINGGAFRECSGLTSVTIPNSVKSIDTWAFDYCIGLTSIKVESGNPKYDSRNDCNAIIETASNMLVSGCKNTVIPNSVTGIGSHAFYGCSSLTSVTIPNSVTSIGEYAFCNCSGLTSVTIPNSVTSIGNYAFAGCTGLTSVTIGNSVKSIGDGAFSNCSGLTSIKVESGNTTYDSRNDCNAIIETASNTLVVGCKNTVIPNSVTRIGDYAFRGCSGLTSVTIPNSVTSIGNWAFAYCSNLQSVISEIERPFTIDSSVFDSDTESNGQLTVPKGKKSVYQSTYGWKEFSNIVEDIVAIPSPFNQAVADQFPITVRR